MTKPINLNKARKARARSDKEQQAVENRAKFGRTKAQKQADKHVSEKTRKTIEDAKRER